MATLGDIQIKKFKTFAPEISTKKHFSEYYNACPKEAEKIVTALFESKYGISWEKALANRPVREYENDDYFIWELVSKASSNKPLAEARDENGVVIESTKLDQAGVNGMVGSHGMPFTLVFEEQCFFEGETVVGNLNELYPMVIISKGKAEGTRVAYQVQLSGGNIEGIPADRLLRGERFSHEANYVEADQSQKVGGLRFSTNSKMREEWSTIRLYHTVGGELHRDGYLDCKIPYIRETDGKVDYLNFFMAAIERTFDYTFNKMMINAQLFGVSNRNANGQYTVIGKSGNVVKTGNGLYTQMRRGARVKYYNKFNIKELTDEIGKLCMNANMPMDKRKIVITTGELGMIWFHEAVERETSGWINVHDEVGKIRKTNNESSSNALAAGYQYTEYLGPNNVLIQVQNMPYYNDKERNKILINGYPAFSARFDIFDIGSDEEPNVILTRLKGEGVARGYINGLRNPFTRQDQINFMATDVDGSSMHRKSGRFGVQLIDPTRVISFIPQVLQG